LGGNIFGEGTIHILVLVFSNGLSLLKGLQHVLKFKKKSKPCHGLTSSLFFFRFEKCRLAA